MHHKILGTTMWTKCAPPDACLTEDYQEEGSSFK